MRVGIQNAGLSKMVANLNDLPRRKALWLILSLRLPSRLVMRGDFQKSVVSFLTLLIRPLLAGGSSEQ